MVRPTTIGDDLLLATAREVFLRRGLQATTAEIAEQAGVSQGILFKRFKSKQALFRAAMNVDADPTKPLPISLSERVGRGKVEDTLKDLGILLVKKFFSIIPATMMDWSNSREETEIASGQTCEAGPERAVKGLQLIADFLSREADLGRVKCTNCEVVAQTFIGALWHYTFLQVTMGEVHRAPITAEQYVDEVVRTLMIGIAPERKSKKSEDESDA
jgi:AcrR family transcriptional regulator